MCCVRTVPWKGKHVARELPTDVTVGTRVRAARRLAGLTQETMAAQMHVSPSLVRKVEQLKVGASPTFVNAAASTLGLTPGDLYGQNEQRDYGHERRDVAALETTIETGLDLYFDDPPAPLGQLTERVAMIATAKRAAQYSQCVYMLPGLIGDLTTFVASNQGETERKGYAQLSLAYNLAMHVLYRLGSPQVMLAAERSISAAVAAQDPLLTAYQHVERALPLLHRGSLGPAQRLLHQVFRDIDGVAPGTAEANSVRGFTHLRLAIVDARAGDTASSDGHLDEAQVYADQLPDLADYYNGAFCRTNVTIHRVGAAVDSNRPDLAIQRNRPMPTNVLRSRQTHHRVDLARAFYLTGDKQGAFATLGEARAIGPELVRYHPQVRELVGVMAADSRRSTDSLFGFAKWMGVKV